MKINTSSLTLTSKERKVRPLNDKLLISESVNQCRVCKDGWAMTQQPLKILKDSTWEEKKDFGERDIMSNTCVKIKDVANKGTEYEIEHCEEYLK